MYRLTIALFISLGLMGLALGQKLPKTATESLKAVQAYLPQQADAAKKAGRAMDYRAWQAGKVALAKKYAALFPVESLTGAELLAWAQLQREAGDLNTARLTLEKYLAAKNLAPAERAEGLQQAVFLWAAPPYTDDTIRQAEVYLARLDQLDAAFTAHKIKARSRLAGYYSYSDIDEPNIAHHAKLLELIKSLPAQARQEFQSTQADAYSSIALVQANRADITQAIATLRQGLSELPADARERAWLTESIKRYEFIGQTGAAIKGDYWLNAVAGQKELEVRGRVTLIQFTAHWCGPCRKSYPAMLKFHEKFAAQGMQALFSTQLYGFFEKQQNLAPDAEVDADKKYFLEHYTIPFPVAIGLEAKSETVVTNEKNYLVGGIPQIVLLDKQGVVRLILIGWDNANEARVTRMIESLL